MKQRIHDFLNQCHVFYLATTEHGQPRVRPFGAHLYIDEELYFFTNTGKSVYQQLCENPLVEICSYNEGAWIRLTGEVEFVDDDKIRRAFLKASPKRARMFYRMPTGARKALLEKIPGLKNMLSADTDYMRDSRPFRLKNAEAKLYSLKDETLVYHL